ncbi:hypothetical protein [Nocardioides sp. SR21]|uniref:hypothetical protein n=1 Tax=Nocardioides sp. SR21 TaxID=2919501 RepID=UPI001FA9BB25|nr:hypothetical protein [Nocardioides sp. SR21]
MIRLRTRRALLALVVPALAVTLLPSGVTAAGPGPGLPKLAAVARIYPHLADGQVTRSPADGVSGVRANCEDGKVIEGAVGRSASYSTKRHPVGTPRNPSVDTSTMRFGSADRAEMLMNRIGAAFADCLLGDSSVRVTEFTAPVGDQRFGYVLRMDIMKRTLIMRWLVARDGRYVVLTGASSMGKKTPALAPFVRFTRLSLRAAR